MTDWDRHFGALHESVCCVQAPDLESILRARMRKIVLQQYRHLATKRGAAIFWSLLGDSGHRAARTRNGPVAIDRCCRKSRRFRLGRPFGS